MAPGRKTDPNKELPLAKRYQTRKHNLKQKTPIDWELVAKWVTGGASGVQCAHQLGIAEKTLYGRVQVELRMHWSSFYDMYRARGDRMIHNKQFEIAMKGDRNMLMWLGKQRLKQSDKIDQTVEIQGEVITKTILSLPDNGNRFIEKIDE